MLLDANFAGTSRADCTAPAPAGCSSGPASASSCTGSIRRPSAGASISPAGSRRRGDRAAVLRGLPGRRALAVAAAIVLPPLGIWLLYGGWARPAHGRDARMGRADADHVPLALCRADRDAARHPAGARTALAAAGHPDALDHLHRVLARRADRRGDLPRLDPAAADHAVRRRHRPPRARRDRARPRDRRLHGGSRARRPAGGPRRPARGRTALGLGYWRSDRLHRAAAGAAHRAARDDQRVHLAVQEHHAGADRLDPRPARHRAGGAGRSRTGSA